MQYTVSVTRPGQPTDDNPARYDEPTAALLLTRALRQGLTLTADADTGRITLTDDGRRITLAPAEPLPRPTAAQLRELLALAASPGPLTFDYGRSNVLRLRDGHRLLAHSTTMALDRGGYLTANTGKGGPAALTLAAHLTLARRPSDRPADVRSTTLADTLRRAYAPAPATTT